MELPKSYDPTTLEPALYEWWDGHGLFAADADADGEPFSIVIPPPNVTGSLHIGHALDNTLQDVLVRRARMQGRNAVWIPGTDHAGIATQTVVERQLAEQGITRQDLGRDAFIAKVWEWREQSGGRILHQLRRLGASCDWQREAFTFDEQRSAAVRRVFCDLHDAGLIYRGTRLINWDPKARTALSDIEVEHEVVKGRLASFRYPGSDGSDGVVVATTRPETMLGDTAVAVHPDDERYRHLIGTTVRLPLVDREIPIIADDHVDPEFGSGAVKVTPAHDPNDYEIGLRHDLPMIDVMTDDGRINEHGGAYAGLDRFEARTRVVADLDALGLLVADEPYEHSVGHSERSKVPIEPRLSEQWFVRMQPLAQPAIAAVRDGRTTFVPERNAKGFLRWLEDLHDWCISRQIWWGHRIPAWYDADGGIHVLREDPTPDQIEELGLVRQDDDVLDTWFSSQLWPFTTMGWPDETAEMATWFPTSVLVTGYDINTFWVSRMLMVSLFVHGEVPFRTVLNHGLVRDATGKKMSKSFGNVIDPLDLADTYGADALRFALLRAAPPGQDVPLAEEWVEGGRRFANKLWNVARLVMDRAGVGREGGVAPADGLPDPADLRLEDRWILSRLESARLAADAAYDDHDIAPAARGLYHFVWDELADWYLELAKLRDDRTSKQVLVTVLDQAVRLLHPIMPFVTEAIWGALHDLDPDQGTALMRADWPTGLTAPDPDAERDFTAVQEVVAELRKLRAGYDLPPSRRIQVAAVCDGPVRALLEGGREGIERLAGVDAWTFVEQAPDGLVGKVLAAGAELYVSLEGIVDLDAELARLEAELGAARSELSRAEGKLANTSFVANAPDAVVDAERRKVTDWTAVITTLEAQIAEMGAAVADLDQGPSGAFAGGRAAADTPAALTAAELAAHVEALNLTGLSFCVRRLLGKDPQPVTGQFTMWARQDRKGLPGVTQGLWAVLRPLRIGRPQSPAAAVCDQVLKGRERDGSVALKAASDCAGEGKSRFRPLPAGIAASAPQQKALVDAVKDYWRTVGTMYGEVRAPVVGGDLPGAVRHIRQAEQALRPVVERIADLAGELGDDVTPDSVTDLEPDQVSAVARATPVTPAAEVVGPSDWAEQTHVDEEGYAPAPRTGTLRGTGPLRRTPEDDPDVPDPIAARAEAFARQQRLREETPPEPLPVEVLSTKPVRNHVFLPVVFLLITAGLAMYVIFSVLNAPNPLAQ